MALFKILKGNEANLPSDKHEGWAYVTEKGNMYVDLSNDKRVKIGNRADSAEFADKATGDTKPIRDIYLAKLAQVESTGSKFTFRGITGGGDNAPDLISIPLAGDLAGLVSNAAQTIKGNKTFFDGISFPTIATWPTVSGETYPIQSKGLSWSGSSDNAKIYYEVQGSDKGMLVIESGDDTDAGAIFRNASSKKEVIIRNGLVTGTFAGNLTGTASHATADGNGNNIAATYVADVSKKKNSNGSIASHYVFRVTKGDGTYNDVDLHFAASASCGGAANSALTVGQGNDPNIAFDANDITVAQSKKTFYSTNTDKMTNRPSGTHWGYLDAGAYSSSYMTQTFTDGANANTYIRVKNNTWGDWKQFAFTDGTIQNAQYAEKDKEGNVIADTYIATLKKDTSNGTTFSFKGVSANGDVRPDTISIPAATALIAGLVTTGTQTWTGAKTLDSKGSLVISKAAGFNYTGIETATAAQYRDVWFADSSRVGTPVHNSKFQYNPACTDKWASYDTTTPAAYGSLKADRFTGVAQYAAKDVSGNLITSYIATLKQDTSNGTTFSFKGVSGGGDNRPDVISIPAASATVAGLVTNAAQTFAGVKTFKNNIDVKGKVIIDLNGNKVEIGSDNKSYFHFLIRSQATTPLTFWFGGPIQTAGNITPYGHNTYDLGSSSSRWKTGYFGSGGINVSGTITDKDANELRAKLFVSTIYANTSTGSSFIIGGKNTAGDEITSLTIPNASTTKAGLVTNVAQTLAGNKTFTGDIYISHATVADMTYNTTNPKLVFSENGGQPVGIVYTDYDSYRSPAGLKIMSTVSNNSAAWLEVEGAFYAGGDIYDKNKDILLATKYIASLVGSQGSTNYTITPKNQDGTNLSNILNVPINLVGSANTSSKIFLIGTTSQNATAQTGYSHDTVYIDSDGFLYDSGNKPSYHSVVTISDTNNYPWHRIARTNEITSSWYDGTILLYISQDYNGGSYGILRVSLRTNNISSGPNASLEGEWITRSGFSKSSFKLALYSAANKVYADLYYVSPGTYAGITIKQIQQGSRGSLNQSRWFLTSSNEVSGTTASDKKTSKGYASQAAAQTGLRNGVAYTSVSDTVDASRVNEANYADRALYDWNGNDIRKKYIATLAVKTTNGTTFTFKGSSMEGDELSAVTIPAATASIAGLVTNGVQTWAGNKTLNNDLYVKGKVAVSTTSANGYNLYVNGTSYFVSDVKIKTQLYLEAHGKDRLLFTDANKKVVTGGHYANSSQIGINITNTTTIGDYTLYTNGTSNFADTIYIRPCRGNYCEGLRIYQYGSWSDILLGGNDLTANTGTSANSWFIGNNNGTLNITRNGSSTGTAYLRCVSNKWYINTTSGAEQLNVGGWVGTVGNSGWYSITHGGGWYMADANFIRNYGSKAMSVNIASNNSWGIGSHRLAAVFKGNDHVSILLSTNTLGYGLCVNNNGNWYWGKRASNSETATSKDTYLLQGNTTLVRPSTDMAIGLGQVKSAEFSNAFIRATSTRHLDASGVYSGDMHLYIGYGSNSPTQKTLFYYSTGTHGAAATSRTQFAEINSNGLYALTRFGVNGQSTSYNFYVNGTSLFGGLLRVNGAPIFGYRYSQSNNAPAFVFDKPGSNYTGIGGNGASDTIYFGAVGADGNWNWNTSYKQKWVFNGSVTADSFVGTASAANKLNLTRSISGTSHANALQTEFTNNKASIPRNCLNTYYSSAYSNGSFYMGYFLSGYDSNPYGGFFVAHYNTPYYVGISNGTFSEYQIWKRGDSVTSAVWNDYAECRKADSQEPGYVMFEKGDDSLGKTIERLQHFAGIVSDTWGFSQGETTDAKTNIAVAGRVLAYPYRDRNEYKPGDCVCAAPGGKVDIMTREEIVQYPDRIVGTVSCVPGYEEWGGGENADRDPVKVNGRIWIKVR